VEKHLTLISVINIVFGIILLLVGLGLFIAVAGGGLISQDSEAIFITGIVGMFFAVFFTVLAIPGIIGGVGLLKHKDWARILMLIIAILDFMAIPFGTIIGIYTIWALMKDETIELFQS
jgi:hypothetical protein